MKTRGLVIGKFYPPHNGHSYLIDFAAKQVKLLDVLICDNPAYTISAPTRRRWLKHIHNSSKINFKIIPDIGKDDDSKAWGEHTTSFLRYAPDVVFSSESYGPIYAGYMGAEHVMVDRRRVKTPVSATLIRRDVLKHWKFLHPIVRQNFARRICILGAESTGTTTLAKALAKHYRTYWVPEFGRLFSEAAIYKKHIWETPDFTFIAEQQQRIENYFAGISSGLIICDTNAFATRFWHERYMGTMSGQVDSIAANDKPNLYILTDVNIPFVQDGVRDGKHLRKSMHQRFIEELGLSQKPHVVATGSLRERLNLITPQINELIKRKVTI